jgi:hypothetical protein
MPFGFASTLPNVSGTETEGRLLAKLRRLEEADYFSLGRRTKARREWQDRETLLGPMCEPENAIDGSEAASDARRMTAWLWIDI